MKIIQFIEIHSKIHRLYSHEDQSPQKKIIIKFFNSKEKQMINFILGRITTTLTNKKFYLNTDSFKNLKLISEKNPKLEDTDIDLSLQIFSNLDLSISSSKLLKSDETDSTISENKVKTSQNFKSINGSISSASPFAYNSINSIKNPPKTSLNFNKENCKVYFSVYSSRLIQGFQVKVKFEELKILNSSDKFTIINPDSNSYTYFGFNKSKSMGAGKLWIIAKALNKDDALYLYSKNSRPDCNIRSEFVLSNFNCYSSSGSVYQSLTYLYTDQDDDDTIRFSIWSKLDSGYNLKVYFVPMENIEIDSPSKFFVPMESNCLTHYKITIDERYLNKKLFINVLGGSTDQTNLIYMTTSVEEPNCRLIHTYFPNYKSNCYNTCRYNSCSYSANTSNNTLEYKVTQKTTLYLSVEIEILDVTGSYIKVTSQPMLQFLNDK